MHHRISLWAAAVLSLVLAQAPARAGDLSVTVEGVVGSEGEIEAILYPGEDAWLDNDHPGTLKRRVAAADAVDGVVTLVFDKLDPGPYALAIYHDADMSGELERGFMWAPKEGWAFSNNITPRFGPPNYKKAKLDVGEDEVVTTVQLDYP